MNKKIQNKIFLGAILLILIGLLISLKSNSVPKDELANKETILDSDSDGDDEPFPLLSFLVESDTKKGESDYDFSQSAYEKCQAEVEGVVDLTPSAKSDYSEKSCVVNDKELYKIRRLKITGCDWTPGESRNIQIEALQSLKKEIVFENIRILFRNKVMLCEADMVVSANEKIPVVGNCAVAENSNFASVNGKKPKVGEDPIYVAFDLQDGKSSVEKTIKETSGIGANSHLLISMSIPLNSNGSDYLSYMLSNEAMTACEAKEAR